MILMKCKRNINNVVLIVCIALLAMPMLLEAAPKYTFKYATYAPSKNIFTKVSEEYAKRLEVASNGQIKIVIYPNAALCSGADQFKSVSMGMIDMTDLVSDYLIGELDMLGIGCLPLAYDRRKAHLIGEEARGLITERLRQDDIEYLFTYDSGGNDIFLKNFSTKEPVLKGMKIRASGIYPIEAITAIGATPIQMSTGEVYMAIETGLVDGAAIGVLSWAANTLYEVLPVLYDVSITPSWFSPVINRTAYQKLPKDLQDVMKKVAKEFAPIASQMVENKRDELIKWAVKEKNCKVYTLSEKELKPINEAMGKIQDEYVNKGDEYAIAMWEIVKKYK